MELISQIKEAQDPIEIIQQFVQTVSGHKETLPAVLIRLFNALRSKSLRQRGNISFALCALLRRMKSDVDAHEVYVQSKNVLLRDSSTPDGRHSTLAALLAWNAMIKSGIFPKDSEDLVPDMMRNCQGIANERLCYRTVGYSTLWSLIDYAYSSTAVFKEKMFPELVNELGATVSPGHADSFWLWLHISKKFHGLPLKSWAGSATKAKTMRALSSTLEGTVKWLPEVHPLWGTLVQTDAQAAMQVVHNAMQLWGEERLPAAYVPMIAAMAAFKVVDVQHFIKLLEDHSQYFSYMNTTTYADAINNAIIGAAEVFGKAHRHRMVALTSAALKCVRSKHIGKLACRLDDEETKELVELVNEHDFDSCLELLWAQTRRESLEDSAIVGKLFAVTMSKVEEDEDRLRLLPLFAHCAEQVASDGRHWFSLISSEVHKVGHLIVKNAEAVCARAKDMLLATSDVHKLVGVEEHAMPEITDFDSVVAAGATLVASRCDLCKAVGRAVLHSAMPYADKEMVAKITCDPVSLVKALAFPGLAGEAIQAVLAKVSAIPRTISSRPEAIVIDIDEAGAEAALVTIKTMMKRSDKVFVKAIASTLMQKLSEDKCKELATVAVEEESAQATSGDLCTLFMKRSRGVADHVMERVIGKVAGNNKKSPSLSRRAREWVIIYTDRYEDFDPKVIGHAVAVLTGTGYGDSRGERKRAEEALGWAAAFVNSRRSVPLDELQPALEPFTRSQSRKLKQLAEQLRHPKE